MLILEKKKKKIDIGINTIFYVGDKKIKVVKAMPCDDCNKLLCDNNCGYYCDHCFFLNRKECFNFLCAGVLRKDKTDVVYLEQKE